MRMATGYVTISAPVSRWAVDVVLAVDGLAALVEVAGGKHRVEAGNC